jgi:hypothetical protein
MSALSSTENWSEQIVVVCAAVRSGDLELAARELDTRCPLTPLPTSPRAKLSTAPTLRRRSIGLATKRQYSKSQATRILVRDGFCDRYSGDRLIFPGVLRILSDLFPRQFQWHPNWKIGARSRPDLLRVGAIQDGYRDGFPKKIAASRKPCAGQFERRR